MIRGMDVALAVFGVAFAAVCVWLTVRIVNRRERWAKWMLAVVVGLPVLYVASFGPACWWFSAEDPPPAPGYPFDWDAPAFYTPIGSIYLDFPLGGRARSTIAWYATLRHPRVTVPYSLDGGRVTMRRGD